MSHSKPPVNPPPPKQPPAPRRPPNKPPNKTGALADDDLFDLAEVLGYETPARRSPMEARSTTASVRPEETGGPVQPPVAAGKEPTPGSAVAAPVAACESTGAVVAAGAGADAPAVSGRGEARVDGAVGAATFALPPTPALPRFGDRPVRFTCTDKGQHQKVYPRVVFELTKTRFRCGRCNRDVQLGEDRFADVLATLRAAGISEVDVSALPRT